jgi:hypothetical protein
MGTCPQCGAAIRKDDGRFCSHCGAALPDRPRITADEWPTHAERFAQARRDPAFERALAAPVPPPRLAATVLPVGVFAVIWVVFGGVIIRGATRGPYGATVLFPIAIVTVGLVGIIATIAKAVRKAKAPVERRLAVVIDERTEINTTGSGDDRRTTTRYYTALQDERGDRVQASTPGALAGVIARGDIGVAVLRGGDLVDFHRIRV